VSATAAERERLGANIRRIMRERGMTQRQLAKAIGKTETRVSNYVNGKSDMGIRSFTRICEALECGVDDLLEGVVE
jgi:transcriptional regulator with XRE-family HTH domain